MTKVLANKVEIFQVLRNNATSTVTLKRQNWVQITKHFIWKTAKYGLDPDLDPEPDPKLFQTRIQNGIRNK